MSNAPAPILCTLCGWFALETPATWRGLSPSHTWHYLCDTHRADYGGKYSMLHTLTPELARRLFSGSQPFGKDS